jgi:hypothetical protein
VLVLYKKIIQASLVGQNFIRAMILVLELAQMMIVILRSRIELFP